MFNLIGTSTVIKLNIPAIVCFPSSACRMYIRGIFRQIEEVLSCCPSIAFWPHIRECQRRTFWALYLMYFKQGKGSVMSCRFYREPNNSEKIWSELLAFLQLPQMCFWVPPHPHFSTTLVTSHLSCLSSNKLWYLLSIRNRIFIQGVAAAAINVFVVLISSFE